MSTDFELGFTHIALHVGDVKESMAFYVKYAGLSEIHQRGSVTTTVGWISDCKRPFGIVLLRRRGGKWRRWLGRLLARFRPALAHIGVVLSSKEEVDSYCELAKSEGILLKAPRDAGHPVGYYGMIADPDGNCLELSYGQHMGEVLTTFMNHGSETTS